MISKIIGLVLIMPTLYLLSIMRANNVEYYVIVLNVLAFSFGLYLLFK